METRKDSTKPKIGKRQECLFICKKNHSVESRFLKPPWKLVQIILKFIKSRGTLQCLTGEGNSVLVGITGSFKKLSIPETGILQCKKRGKTTGNFLQVLLLYRSNQYALFQNAMLHLAVTNLHRKFMTDMFCVKMACSVSGGGVGGKVIQHGIVELSSSSLKSLNAFLYKVKVIPQKIGNNCTQQGLETLLKH